MITDEKLYKGYLDGDDANLTLLMERYGNRLTLYINVYLHDLYDSEDLMIEAFAYLISIMKVIFLDLFLLDFLLLFLELA